MRRLVSSAIGLPSTVIALSVVTVTADSNTSGVNFSMTRAEIATITGTVTDENDQKLNGWAFVDLFTYPTSGKINHENKNITMGK